MNNILILGSGGREHALSWKICQSDLCNDLYIAPGNAGTASIGTNIKLSLSEFPEIASFCLSKNVNTIIVGPEIPLVEGIYDFFRDNHPEIKVFGPSKKAAQLEGSKDFANAFMSRHNIPTAAYQTFTKETLKEGLSYIDQRSGPFVLKADGLAAGKGVLIIEDKTQAQSELTQMLDGKFGTASKKVVIEEFLDGIEFSVFVITDGQDYITLPIAKDYKRIGEGDTGLNTGGMGSISPVSFVDDELLKKVETDIIVPTINGLKKESFEYKGVIFFGLIKVGDDPYVIEYNCRFGDPETEVVVPRIDSDLLAHLLSVFDGSLKEQVVKITSKSASCIMLVSGGYPESYEKGKLITLPPTYDSSLLLHAGTKKEGNSLLTNGGRVLAITSFADDYRAGILKSMKLADEVKFENKYFRKDIGFDL